MGTLSLKNNPAAVKRVKAVRKALKIKEPPPKNSAQRYAEKQEKIAAARAKVMGTRAMLVDRFPKCFKPAGQPKLPLAVGIDKMLFDAMPDVARHLIRRALHDYTSGASYLQALMTHAWRYRLDGSIGGEVSPDHVTNAEKQLEEALERKAERAKHKARMKRKAKMKRGKK